MSVNSDETTHMESEFHSNTMLENYIRLLNYIVVQMYTDQIDYTQQTNFQMKSYIKYYLEHLNDDYKWELTGIIPLEILKEKILNESFGFGNPLSTEDNELSNKFKDDLAKEIFYRVNRCKCVKRYQCWYCRVRDCGCKAHPSCCGEY